MELYKKYRPKKLKDVVGQSGVVKSLSLKIKKNKVPHAILFSGPSGCGKTTVARIIKRKIGCGNHDFKDINCADFRGIDMVRDIRQRMTLSPIDGECLVWLIDECHKLSNDAMNAMLKILEDTPDHVYFMLCTTDPQKLLRTIRTRCTEYNMKSLSAEDLESLLVRTCKDEKVGITTDVFDKIIDNCAGSPRQALVLLDQIIDMTKEKDMMESIQSSAIESDAFEIAKALLYGKSNWSSMTKILKSVDISKHEGLRAMIMNTAKNNLLNNRNTGRAYLVMESFSENFFDRSSPGFDTGECLFVAACYEVIHGEN